jgi:multiple sugar transport system substrate-binding protein
MARRIAPASGREDRRAGSNRPSRTGRHDREDDVKGFSRRALIGAAALAMVALAPQARADEQTIVWWDFLGGGDGIRMKEMIKEFNEAHAGKVRIDATTLEWGAPYYTKVQTSAATGQGPDVMTYHESRIPLGVKTNALSEIKPEELKAAGINPEDFEPANWKKAQVDGKQYAVPLDMHSIVLMYNKTKLKEAGLLGDDGFPVPSMMDSAEHFNAALAKLTTADQQAMSVPTADGTTGWRIFYSLFVQQKDPVFFDGQEFLPGDNVDKAAAVLEEMGSWVKNGWVAKQTEYPASIALFTSGKAAMHLNGVWEIPTMVDLAKQGKLFDWGAVPIPVFFDHAGSWADSHAFAIPNRVGNEVSPEKRALVLETIHWFNEHSLLWGTGGHLPAFGPVRESKEFQEMKPNSDYAAMAKTMVFEPVTTLTGPASPVYEAATNFIGPAMNNEADPKEAAQQFKDDLQSNVD